MSGIYLAPYGTPAPARLEYDRLVRQLAAATSLPPWHLTFEPIAPTRQESPVNLSAQHNYDDAYNCPRCETGSYAPSAQTPEEPIVAETPTTSIEYGKKTGGAVTWPDDDGELYFEGAGYVDANDLAKLRRLTASGGDVTLVQRAVTYGPTEDVKPALPTVSGSVVRVLSGLYSPSGTTYALTTAGTWCRADGSNHFAALGRLAASDFEILHDAGAAS